MYFFQFSVRKYSVHEKNIVLIKTYVKPQVNVLAPEQNDGYFTHGNLKCVFLKKKIFCRSVLLRCNCQ